MTSLEVITESFSSPCQEKIVEDYQTKFTDKQQELLQEISQYQQKKQKELKKSRRINRWSIGIALALSTACTISTAKKDAQDLTMILGTLSVTFHSWIASVPMSKKVSLYERILVKADNLRSDLQFQVEDLQDLEMIREEFKALKVELIEESPQGQIFTKVHGHQKPSA